MDTFLDAAMECGVPCIDDFHHSNEDCVGYFQVGTWVVGRGGWVGGWVRGWIGGWVGGKVRAGRVTGWRATSEEEEEESGVGPAVLPGTPCVRPHVCPSVCLELPALHTRSGQSVSQPASQSVSRSVGQL